jgi:hypothetical protein
MKLRYHPVILYEATGIITLQGALLQAKIKRLKEERRGEPSKRGKVKNIWSRQSRARLAKTLFSLLPAMREGYNYALTLTYRQRTPEESKKDLRLLHMRIRYLLKHQAWFAIWKMEFQLRGVVHYHILLHTEYALNLTELREYISHAWAEITGDEQLAITGTRVDRIEIKRVEQAMIYILGHATSLHKEYQNQASQAEWTGRWWGVWNKPQLPKLTMPATFHQMHQLKRALAKIRPIPKRCRSSFWTYCEPELFLRLIETLFDIQESMTTNTRQRHAIQQPSAPIGNRAAPNRNLIQVHPP